jgi:hypothetical protein
MGQRCGASRRVVAHPKIGYSFPARPEGRLSDPRPGPRWGLFVGTAILGAIAPLLGAALALVAGFGALSAGGLESGASTFLVLLGAFGGFLQSAWALPAAGVAAIFGPTRGLAAGLGAGSLLAALANGVWLLVFFYILGQQMGAW